MHVIICINTFFCVLFVSFSCIFVFVLYDLYRENRYFYYFMKTRQQVRQEFVRAGQSLTSWAKEHGYPTYIVQQVLAGKTRCLRGKSHEIAVLLELKDGYIRQELPVREVSK